MWRSNNLDSRANSTTEIQIKWVNVQIPVFDIVLNGGKALASQDNVFYVDLYNYPTDDPDLFISWDIEPSIIDEDNNIQLS